MTATQTQQRRRTAPATALAHTESRFQVQMPSNAHTKRPFPVHVSNNVHTKQRFRVHVIHTHTANHSPVADRSAHSHDAIDRISQGLTQRLRELAERYEMPMPQLNQKVAALEDKVNAHLAKMGFLL